MKEGSVQKQVKGWETKLKPLCPPPSPQVKPDYEAMFLVAVGALKEINDMTEHLHLYNPQLSAKDYRKIIEKCLDRMNNSLLDLDQLNKGD